MAYILRNGADEQSGIKSLILDSLGDLTGTGDCAPGSTAQVAGIDSMFIMSQDGYWVGTTTGYRVDPETGGGTPPPPVQSDNSIIDGTFSGTYTNDTVTSIRDYCFYNYGDGLTGISLPRVTTIGSYAFSGCAISSISLPECKTIGSNAFYNVPYFSSIVLPSIERIEARAFGNCTPLKSVYLPNDKLCVLAASNVFSSVQLDAIYVPSSLYYDYIMATNWSSYSSIIRSL